MARTLCDTWARAPEIGLSPIRYADGTLSTRAWTLTFPIEPVERAEIPFQPMESVFVFRSGDGYLVYSVCSHPRQPDAGRESHLPFHAIELVQDQIDRQALEPGPIRTLITGTCGMQQALQEDPHGPPPDPAHQQDLLMGQLTALASRTGLRYVYLSHCGLMNQHLWPAFLAVFGTNVQRALPGSCIPL